MALTAQEIESVRARFANDISRKRETLGVITKSQLVQAVSELDKWLDTALVTSADKVEQVAAGGVTDALKLKLLRMVIEQREASEGK